MHTNYLRRLAVACLSVFALAAAEHHGLVKFGGLPVPGATVTATQGDRKFVAVTDPQGAYSFRDLPDGVWTIQVEMLCFAPIKQEVAVAPNAPSPEWEMKLLPLDDQGVRPATGAPRAGPLDIRHRRAAADRRPDRPYHRPSGEARRSAAQQQKEQEGRRTECRRA